MATTRKKPATATKAAATPKPAKKAGTASATVSLENATAIASAVAASAAGATAVAEPPSPRAGTVSKAPTKANGKVDAPSGIERRRTPREKLVAPAVLQPASGDASVDRGVQVQDLSLGGVGFVASEKFDPGEIYRITLGKGPLLLNARVKIISCNKTGHRMYRCGAEFC
jgi:hypothetical protein